MKFNLIRSLTTATMIATSSLILNMSSSLAAVFTLHEGANNPISEGWTQNVVGSGVAVGAVTNDLGQGIDAWFVDDNVRGGQSGLFYTIGLPELDVAEVNTQGWTYRGNLRIIDTFTGTFGLGSIGIGIGVGNRAYTLFFSQNNGVPIVRRRTNPGQGIITTLTGFDNGYHTYELSYDPDTASTTLEVDGIEIFSGYTGESIVGNSVGFSFGSFSSFDDGRGHYNLIEFETESDEPESIPESSNILGLILVGGGFLFTGIKSKKKEEIKTE